MTLDDARWRHMSIFNYRKRSKICSFLEIDRVDTWQGVVCHLEMTRPGNKDVITHNLFLHRTSQCKKYLQLSDIVDTILKILLGRARPVIPPNLYYVKKHNMGPQVINITTLNAFIRKYLIGPYLNGH